MENSHVKLTIIRTLLFVAIIVLAFNTFAANIKMPKLFVQRATKSEVVVAATTKKAETTKIETTKELAMTKKAEIIKATESSKKVEATTKKAETTKAETTKETMSKKAVVKKKVAPAEKPNTATRSEIDKILIAGDIYFSKKTRAAYDEKGLNGIIDDKYIDIISSSDFFVANLECPITNQEESDIDIDKEYYLSTPEKYVKAIKELGIDVMTIANNHILDFGKDAFINTMNILSKNGISFIGAGKNDAEARKPFIKTIRGKKYAFFAASAVVPDESWMASADTLGVSNGYDIATVCKDIGKYRKEVDFVIVYMHWGEELAVRSNSIQKTYAHKLIDFGADLVVGSHPHVTQEIEYYKGRPIVYSLGNFIYGSTSRETMLLEVTFDYHINEGGFMLLRIYPGISDYERTKSYLKYEDVNDFCKRMQDICNTCYIADNGYIFTVDAVEKALENTGNVEDKDKMTANMADKVAIDGPGK